MKTYILTIPVLAVLVYVSVSCASYAQASNPGNLADNGGFEKWIPAPKQVLAIPWCPQLPDGLPDGWPLPSVIGHPDGTGVIACDSSVHHGGEHSVRISNGNPANIVDITQCVGVDPDARYLVKLWVKADHVGPSGGAMIHIVGSSDNNKTDGNIWGGGIAGMDIYKTPTPNNGTFDWAEITFPVDALPRTRELKITLQLRNATGTLWYDDLEVTKVERIVHVESY